MRAPAVPLTRKLLLAVVMGLLACSLMPLGSAFAEGEGAAADTSAEKPQEVSTEQADEGSGVAPMLASGLVGNPTSFVSADVALDSEPIIGSFTVDGLTFAVTEGSAVELVGVSSDWQQVEEPQEGDGSPVAPMLASGSDGSTLSVPESITYNSVDYAVASIDAYAFYLSGVTDVELPATVTDVDDRAFRSSDVAAVEVADGNPTYSSFEGALYSAAQSSLLLIPEGKQGTVLLPKTAESAAPSVFSHCPLVTQVSVEEGSAAFASENGLLYTSDLTTLLRVPAGATDITIHDGCTTIAAGAMEACASLATITAPASVASISPYLFEQEPETVMAPVAVAAVEDEAESNLTEDSESADAASQLTAMVALLSTDDSAFSVDAASIKVLLPESKGAELWQSSGFSAAAASEDSSAMPSAELSDASSYAATTTNIHGNGGTFSSWRTGESDRTDINHIVEQSQFLVDDMVLKLEYIPTSTIVEIITLDSRTDCTFMGWSVVAPTSNKSFLYTSGVRFATAADIYANWLLKTFWNPNGGYWGTSTSNTGVESAEYMNTARATSYDGATLPQREGYTFEGWSTDPLATTGSKTVTIGNSPTTYYAVWKAKQCTVTFNLNGSTDTARKPANVTATYGSAMPALSTTANPTRAGYTFGGWYDTDAATGGTQYYTTSRTSACSWDKDTTSTTTLYARWVPKTCTVTFDLNGGNGTKPANVTATYDSAMPTLSTTSKPVLSSAYDFDGWYDTPDSSGGTKYYNADGTSAHDWDKDTTSTTTLYARYVGKVFKVNLDDGEGSGGSGAIYQKFGEGWYADEAATTPIEKVAIPVRPSSGYRFQGYYYEAPNGARTTRIDSAGKIISNNNAFIGEVTFHAKWGGVVAPITLNDNGGSGGSGLVYVCFDDAWYSDEAATQEITTVKVPVRAGYVFDGYTLNGQSNRRIDKDGVIVTGTHSFAGATTLDAQWVKQPVYAITLMQNADDESEVYSTVYLWYDKGWYSVANPDDSTAAMSSIGAPYRPGHRYKGFASDANASVGEYWETVTAFPSAREFTEDTTLYAVWEGVFSAITLNDNGGSGGSGMVYVRFNDAWYSDEAATQEIETVKVPVRAGYVFDGYTWIGQSRRRIDKNGLITTGTLSFTAPVTLDAQWVETSATFEAGEGGVLELKKGTSTNNMEIVSGGLSSYEAHWDAANEVNPYAAGWWLTEEGTSYAYTITPKRPGCAMVGWKVAHPDGTESVIDAASGKSAFEVGATYTAQWTPIVSADAPIDVTVSVDLLGIEDQVPASGYIESRSGGALKVAAVDFAPLDGAAALFGSRTADVALEALAGERATSADVSFSLDAEATEADAAKLAAFALPDGFGTRIPIGYRFRIPDDVLSSIDPARFEQVTTPVCSVYYTVALANQEGTA